MTIRWKHIDKTIPTNGRNIGSIMTIRGQFMEERVENDDCTYDNPDICQFAYLQHFILPLLAPCFTILTW